MAGGSFRIVAICACCVALWVVHAESRNKTESECKATGYLVGNKQSEKCNTADMSECCQDGQRYPQYRCSPPLSSKTKAYLTLNSFQKGRDGGSEASCDGKFHSDNDPVVALSTGWFDDSKRCFRKVKIHARGKSAVATVVDECDSVNGCDAEHDFQPPCSNNIVDASKAVWKALGVPENDGDYGYMKITWEII